MTMQKIDQTDAKQDQLAPLRLRVGSLLVGFLWLHVPLVLLVVWWLDPTSPMLIASGSLVTVSVVTILWKVDLAGPTFRYAWAAGYMGVVALLLASFAGHPWQIDVHMYFFAALAIASAMCDWRAVVVAAASVAVHHLALNFLTPNLIFPDGSDFARVVLHAVVLIAETVALVWMIIQIQRLFETAETISARKTGMARETARTAEALASQHKTALDEASSLIETTQSLRSELDSVIGSALKGDFSGRVRSDAFSGAFRELAEDLNSLVAGLDRSLTDVARMLEAMSNGDLSPRIKADYQGKFGELKENANRTSDRFAEIVSQIQIAASEVEDAAAEITSGTNDLSNRTEQAASNIEETAASTEEMSATVRQNAKSAKNASQLAETANQTASKGGDVVERAVTAMSGIEESAQKITNIIGVIDEIAFQTNLLALNASVEAARAGEAGKGFAVVAQEVRQLAQRSAQAASDIKALIQDSNNQVRDGVQLVNQAGEALGEIVESISKVTGIVREISNASQEQAAGVQEINSSINSMDEMTQQNSALVEESTAAARALSNQAGKLAKLMAFFKLDKIAAPVQQQAVSKPARSIPKHTSNRSAASSAMAAPVSDDGWSEF